MFFGFALLLLGATQQHIAVLDVKPRVGVTSELAQGITDAVVTEVRRRRPKATVIGSEEIRSMMGFERQKQNLGCQDASCLAEIGGALGSDLLIIGTLGRFGKTYLLTLQLVEARTAKVAREASLEVGTKSDEALLAAVGKVVADLFPVEKVDVPTPFAGQTIVDPWAAPAPAAPTENATAAASESGSHALSWSLIGVGAAAAIVAGIAGIEVLSYNSFNSQLTAGTESPGSAATAPVRRNQADNWATSGLVLVGVAAACGVGAAIAW
jgi:hypothetical protein